MGKVSKDEDSHYMKKSSKVTRIGKSGVKLKVSRTSIPARAPTRKELGKGVKSCLKLVTKKPSIQLASVTVSASSLVNTIETFDRPPDSYTEDVYTRAGTYSTGSTDEPGKRIPKIGAYAEAGVGRAKAECSIFEAEAKGPNASASAELSLVGASAMARAEVASVSASAGPIKAKLGLSLDTGASVGLDGIEVKLFGTGIKIGPETSISVPCAELRCVIQ